MRCLKQLPVGHLRLNTVAAAPLLAPQPVEQNKQMGYKNSTEGLH